MIQLTYRLTGLGLAVATFVDERRKAHSLIRACVMPREIFVDAVESLFAWMLRECRAALKPTNVQWFANAPERVLGILVSSESLKYAMPLRGGNTLRIVPVVGLLAKDLLYTQNAPKRA
jgi:hypothetical protein